VRCRSWPGRVYGARLGTVSGDPRGQTIGHQERDLTATAIDDDAYAILGVEQGADDAAIAAAHRRLAWQHHPDVAGDDETGQMMTINAAFDAIRTAARRAAYDERRGGSSHRPGGSDTAGSTHTTGAADRDRLRWRPPNDGTGKAGPPPGRPSGSVLDFGRHKGWSMGEIVRVDPGYLAWLEERPEGRPYLEEIDAILRRVGYRPGGKAPAKPAARGRRGVFRRD
jgi:curved DNA-binding protein CbpA